MTSPLAPARLTNRRPGRALAYLLGWALLGVAASCGGGPAAPTAAGGATPTPAPTPAAACGFSASANSVSLGARAVAASLTVTASASCTWTVSSDQAFLTVTSPATQTGSATVSFSVAENTGAARQGRLTFGGAVNPPQQVLVNQSAVSSPALTFAPPAPPDAVVGVPYRFSFAVATGGVPPIHYQLDMAGGFPPIGLVLDPAGLLSGTPTVASSGATSAVCAVDAVGQNVCPRVTMAVTPEVAAVGSWVGTITLRSGCVDPLPYVYSWSGTIRRDGAGSLELVLTIPELSIRDGALALDLNGSTVSFGYRYGPFRYNYVGTLSSDQRSVNGTFTGDGCNPPLNTQQSGTWEGTRR